LGQLDAPRIEQLKSISPVVRRDAAFAAGVWQLEPRDWISPLTEALCDPDREVAFDAAFALGEYGPEAEHAIDPLLVLRFCAK
jgi:HEAT repeat protein